MAIGFSVALLAWPAMAKANVGDTMADLRNRYGSAKDMGGQMVFEVRLEKGQFVAARGGADTADHLTITVYFDGVNSAMEVFARNTSDPAKAELKQADIDAILAVAGEGHDDSRWPDTWHPIEVPTGHPTWVTSDKKLIARFSPNESGKSDGASVLVIMLYTVK
jgi:hypothetical protein